MGKLKAAGIWLAGLDQTPTATLYTATDLKGPLGLVVGSEGEGLGRLVRETCDYVITLPMRGRVGSLNASVAGAVALYEILRQRG
jgi:23S rRNA (guanosine2251-2'-O)-methyltransferase